MLLEEIQGAWVWTVYSVCRTRRCCTARTERLVLEMVDILWTIFILRLRLIQAVNRDIISLMSGACFKKDLEIRYSGSGCMASLVQNIKGYTVAFISISYLMHIGTI